MKRFGLNSGYIGIDRRQDEAGIAPLQKAYLERIRNGGNYLPNTPLLTLYPGATAAYSVRRLNPTYSGAALQIRRSSDNLTANIGFDGLNLNENDINSFCSGTNGFVTTWYDQSGNGNNATQVSAGAQPQIYNSVTGIIKVNSRPALYSNNNAVLANFSISLTGNYFISLVSKIDTLDDTNMYLGNSGRNGYLWAFPSLNLFNIRHDGETGGANFTGIVTLSQNYNQTVQRVGTTMYYSQNGTLYTASERATQGAVFTINNLFDSYNGGYKIIGTMQEVVIYASNQSSNRTGIESNINSYYNIY